MVFSALGLPLQGLGTGENSALHKAKGFTKPKFLLHLRDLAEMYILDPKNNKVIFTTVRNELFYCVWEQVT